MRARVRRRVRIGLGAVAAVLLGLGVVLAALVWSTLPGSDRVRVAGLSAPVSIAFDRDGVPRIVAASELDAAAAIGYAHARDRMFEMELMRRAASGRLSEVVGAATLPLDRQMRTFGLRRRAEADLAALPADVRAVLAAYARGVNARIAERGRFIAPEFLVLGRPERWTPVDSLLWGKTMALWLSGNFRDELSRAGLDTVMAPDRVDALWPPPPPTPAPWATLFPAAEARTLLAALPRFPDRFTQPAEASDEWAVDGAHSMTGAPLLAGDPHLAFQSPSLWYLARIEEPGRVLAGATSPGVPFLVLGQNGSVAWSFTTTGADTQDVFVETPAPGGYVTPEGVRPFTVRTERIRVRGRPDVMLRVRETRHGPVINDLTKPDGPVLAVAMANLAPGDTAAAGLLALNRAGSVAEAGRAAAEISSPVQNLLVADRHDIGLFTTGRVPIRRAGDGSRPVKGADGAHDWTGFASGDALPHDVAPASGRLVNGNEPTAPPAFPVFMGRERFGDWRARRVRALLDRMPASIASFARMQADTGSTFAAQVLPRLLAVQVAPGLAAQAQGLLAHWNGHMDLGLSQPLIFNAWLARFYEDVLARNKVPRSAFVPHLEFLAAALGAGGSSWCGGDCTALLQASLASSMRDLAARYGNDPKRWRWGAVHRARFAHPILGRLPVIGPWFTAEVAVPGDDTTLFRSGMARGSFAAVHGAEYRGVYDLAAPERSRFVVVPGQSGNPFSGHAADMLGRWLRGEGVSLGAGAVAAATVRLVP